jgi:hypothetical protein
VTLVLLARAELHGNGISAHVGGSFGPGLLWTLTASTMTMKGKNA